MLNLSSSRFKYIIYFTMTFFLFPQKTKALEIHNIRWGYSNRPVAYKINPVTILVENTESQAFESEIILRQKTFLGEQIGIALSHEVYIAPFEKKWVQFYPYFTESIDSWEVSWNQDKLRGSKSILSPRPVVKPFRVQLVQPDHFSKAIPGIKQFPEDLFPPFLGAVDSLNEILLDHVPKWEKSRRNTFLRWIYTGGILHVFENSNGDLPAFPESYAELNLNHTSSPVHYGNGVIYFYRKNIDAVTIAEFKRLRLRNIKSVRNKQTREFAKNNFAQNSNPSYNQLPENFIYHSMANDDELLMALNELSKTKQIWYLIFLISFIYLMIAGPGYFFITKFSKNHFVFYGTYLGSTALFCLIFLIIGHFSANSTSRIHSLMIAKILPDNELDITEWSSLGIASGGNFHISHPGTSHIYSTCQHFSKVNGTVLSGREGKMIVDIPTNSSRSFFHRGIIPKSSFSVQVNSFLASQTQLEVLSLRAEDDFPKEVIQVQFLLGSKLHQLHQEGNQLVYRGRSRNLASLSGENSLIDQYNISPTKPIPFFSLQDQNEAQSLSHFFPLLLHRALSRSTKDSLQEFQLSENHGILFILSAIPDNLFLESPLITKKEGVVLYCLNVPLKSQTD